MLDEMTGKEIEAGMVLTDKLEAFFYSGDFEDYLETDFFQQVVCYKTEKIEEAFSALPENLRAIAFHHAVLTDDSDIVKACVNAAKEKKANIDTDFCDPEYGSSPLMQACFNSCKNSFSVLVEKGGAFLSVKDNRGRGLAYACLFSHDLDFMKWAIKHGVEFDLNNPVDAVLPLAGAEGTVDVLKWLIEELGGDVNFVDAEGHTALYYACMATEMIRSPENGFLFDDEDNEDSEIDVAEDDGEEAEIEIDDEDEDDDIEIEIDDNDDEDLEKQNRENILYLIDKGAYPTKLSESAFKVIVDRIKELRAQRPTDVIDFEIDREIQRLKEFTSKL